MAQRRIEVNICATIKRDKFDLIMETTEGQVIEENQTREQIP